MGRIETYNAAEAANNKAKNEFNDFLRMNPNLLDPKLQQEFREKALAKCTYDILFKAAFGNYDPITNKENLLGEEFDTIVESKNVRKLCNMVSKSKAFEVFMLSAAYKRYGSLSSNGRDDIDSAFFNAFKQETPLLSKLVDYEEKKAAIHEYAKQSPDEVIENSAFNTGTPEPAITTLKSGFTSIENRYNEVRRNFAVLARKERYDLTPADREKMCAYAAKMLAYKQMYSLMKKFPKDIDLDSVKMVASEEQAILRADALKAGGSWDSAFAKMMNEYIDNRTVTSLAKDSITSRTAGRLERDFQTHYQAEVNDDNNIENYKRAQEKKRDDLVKKLDRDLKTYESMVRESQDDPKKAFRTGCMVKAVKHNLDAIKADPKMPVTRAEALASETIITYQVDYIDWNDPAKVAKRTERNRFVADKIDESIEKNVKVFGEMVQNGTELASLKREFVKLCVERKLSKQVRENAAVVEPYNQDRLKHRLKDDMNAMLDSDVFKSMNMTAESMAEVVKDGANGFDEFNKVFTKLESQPKVQNIINQAPVI